MTKYLIAGLIALSGLLGWGLYHQIGANALLTAQNKTLTEAAERAVERQKAARKVLVARQGKIASQARILRATEAALADALKAHNQWATTPVPTDIQEALTDGH